MSVNGLKSGGFSVPQFRPVSSEGTKTPAVGQSQGQSQGGLKELQSALKELSSNPIIRSLLGESGFDGVKGKHGAHKGHRAEKAKESGKTGEAGEAGKAGEGKAASPEEAVKQLVDGLKKFVQALEQMLGKKNETQAGAEGASKSNGSPSAGGSEGAGGAEGAQSAGGAEGAEGAGAAEGAQSAGGAEGAEGAQQAEGAEGAQEAEEAKDPISKLVDTLKKIVQQLEQLVASLGKQGGQSPNTGIVPAGATSQSGNTGIVPQDEVPSI